jgi:GAF domain-containing protein
LITDNEFAAAVDRQSPEMRRHSIKELATQFKRLLTLLAFTSSIASELNLETAMEQITEQICEILKCDRATLFIIDDQSKLLWSRVRKGNVGELRIPIGKGIASRVAVTGEGVNVANAYQDSTFYSEIDSITGYKTKSVLCLPVKGDNGKPIAVLQALNKQGG